MPADRGTPVAAGRPVRPVNMPLPVRSPVRPGTPGYGVLAAPVVPKGQLNLRAQPTAPIAHQAGPSSTPEHHATPTAHPRPVGPVILKAEHGQPISHDDQIRAQLQAARGDLIRKLYSPPHASGSSGNGGFLSLGSILHPAALAHDLSTAALHAIEGAPHAVSSAANTVAGWGPGLLQGAEAPAIAAWDDLTHGHLGSMNMDLHSIGTGHHSSELGQIFSGAAKTDPLASLINTGNPIEAAKVAAGHPLNTALDALGGESVLGRAVGAASDVAKAGSLSRDAVRAARAARLERAPRVLIPATRKSAALTVPRTYSSDVFRAAAQRAVDRGQLPDLNRVAGNAARARLPETLANRLPPAWRNSEAELATRATEHHAMVQAVETRAAQRARADAVANGLKGEELRKHIQQAVNGTTAELHNQFIAEHAVGNQAYHTLPAARRARTALAKALGVDKEETFTIVKRTAAKGEPQHLWNNRVVGEGASSDAPEFTIIPKPSADRLTAHYSALGNTSPWGNLAARANRNFRETVLAWHPTRWMTGNIGEGGLRAGLAGATPVDAARVQQALHHLENTGRHTEADVFRGHALGGLQYGMNERLSQELDATRAALGKGPSKLAKVGKVYHAFPEKVFDVNRRMEQGIESLAAGKFMRKYMKDHGLAPTIENMANTMTRPDVAREAGRFVRDKMGKYDAFDPQVERVIRTAMPFVPWAKNAVKFLYKDLPTQHPLLTSGLLASHNATNATWVKEHRKGNPDAGNPWSDLATAIKTAPNHWLNVGRYFPTGIGTSGDPIGTALNYLYPVAQGPYQAYLGLSPFGGNLQMPGPARRLTKGGKLSRAQVHDIKAQSAEARSSALSAIIAELGGPVDYPHRISARGGTPYSGEPIWNVPASIKPVSRTQQLSLLRGIERVFNPFHLIDTTAHPKSSASRSSSSGGGNSFGGGGSGGNSFG